jgi:5-oxoprolinase (ATP-hydrolysing)
MIRFWIDRGGTFTDCICVDGDRLHVSKVLSSDDAPLIAIRLALGLAPDDPIPPCEVRMGTTIATNALLTQSGAKTALVTTDGFTDLEDIRDQARPDLFALAIERPPPLAARAIGVASRGAPDGSIVARADERDVRSEIARAIDAGIESFAIVVLHGARAPELERELGEWARRAGASHVSLSHEVDAERGLLARAETSIADAYLTPLIADYVASLSRSLPASRLSILQSSGALSDAAHFRGRNAILSGPAGGAVALAHLARTLGIDRAIGFDMGGTSTDVCRYDGELHKTYETHVAGVRVRAPAMAIHTVAAGGGSLCRFDGQRMRVGPESAGADPGPLAYGYPHAIEPALTDVALALGRLIPDRFPFALDVERSRAGIAAIAARASMSIEACAQGFFEIAIENLAEAIRGVTIARGHDARDYALVIFGGAAGQHACAVARRLGIRRVISHPWAGVLSAFGMGVADRGWHGEGDLEDVAIDSLPLDVFDRLEREGRAIVGVDAVSVRRVDLRYRGAESTRVTMAIEPELARAFEARHREEFGYDRPGHDIVASTARVELIVRADDAPSPRHERGDGAILRRVRAWMDGEWIFDVPVIDRASIGDDIVGPAIILEDIAVIVLEPGWRLSIDARGIIELLDEGIAIERTYGEALDPVRLEIFANAFTSIAEQMGVVLQRSALSTNIRERLDFSCALFDRDGGLVANAPHIPVHLGAMGETVRAVCAAHPRPDPGDVYASNDPSAGGSHLPDITVVTPVHEDGELAFFVASRGHHADVGGITPGSMPPFSRSIAEEGAVLRSMRIVHRGVFDREGVLAVLNASPYPARRPLENIADLEAQIAANSKGARLIGDLCARAGASTVRAYMGHVQDNAAYAVEEAIVRLPNGAHHFEDALDDGARIAVKITVRDRRMDIDFEGTSPELVDQNLNAPRAVTVAAVLYVLRCLVGAPIPLNAGCLAPVALHIPRHSLLDPSPGRAVAGGNVETSQRVVDVLLGALGVAAASQGTMNNVTFGDGSFGYYETLAGGAGATHGRDGASAVHTHMTNSRITDPEVLEDRFPVRLVRFERRRGSGGDGHWRGGDGLVREYELLAPLRFSILSERRTRAPFGVRGGASGAPGLNLHGDRVIGGKAVIEGKPGDRVRIETPGGGGYGKRNNTPE